MIFQAIIKAKINDEENYKPEELLNCLKDIQEGFWKYEEDKFINEFNGLIYNYYFDFSKIPSFYINFINKWQDFWAKDIVFCYENYSKIFDDPYEIFNILEKKGASGLSISRYKGLGEMEVDDLSNTAMKSYKRLVYENEQDAQDLINKLMGEDVVPRKEFWYFC